MPATKMIKVAALLWGCVASVPASAATSCSLAVGQLAFGAYDVFGKLPRDTHTTLQLTCIGIGAGSETLVSVAIGPGANSGSTARRLLRQVGGNDTLAYQIFRDAGRTQPWGDIAGVDTQTLTLPNNGRAQATLMVFGRIPARQDASPGMYADALTVTVTP